MNSSERVLRKIINTGEVGTKAAGCRNSADLELQDGVGLHVEDSWNTQTENNKKAERTRSKKLANVYNLKKIVRK